MSKTVALILARGGSKGIPNKNLIKIGSQPLIYYSIKAALESNVDEVWVSSDSDIILIVSQNLGAKTIKRPPELSTDTSSSEEALLHFSKNIDFNTLVFIQPTSPLIESKYINEGLTKLHKYDSIFSAYREHWIPRWDLNLNPIEWDINNRPRRQDKDEVLVENGAFYITNKENLQQSKVRYSKNIGVVEMPYYKSFQLDTQDDLLLLNKLI